MVPVRGASHKRQFACCKTSRWLSRDNRDPATLLLMRDETQLIIWALYILRWITELDIMQTCFFNYNLYI